MITDPHGQKPAPLFVSLLLDETGSMQSIAELSVKAFNDYLNGLKEADAEVLFSLVTFNSNETRKRFVAEPVSNVPALRHGDYRPDAMTPLIDAACKLINATDNAVSAREDAPDVVIVIQTDGLENCSTEFTSADLAALVKDFTAKGWQFIFLGAGLDAFDAADRAGLHLSQERVMSYGRERSGLAFGLLKEKTANFARHRRKEHLDFSEADRSRAGDDYFGKRKSVPANPDESPDSTVSDFSLRRDHD